MTNEIQHTRGDTLILNGILNAGGVPMNITGCSFVFTIRKGTNKADYPIILQKTGIIADATNGQYDIEANAAEMDIPIGVYLYDIQMTDSLGKIITVSIGKFILTYDIT